MHKIYILYLGEGLIGLKQSVSRKLLAYNNNPGYGGLCEGEMFSEASFSFLSDFEDYQF